jgi:hypothetical protein
MTIDDSSTLAVAWQKSSYSGAQGDCVEVAPVGARIAVRDSKAVHGPALLVDRGTVGALVDAIKGGAL